MALPTKKKEFTLLNLRGTRADEMLGTRGGALHFREGKKEERLIYRPSKRKRKKKDNHFPLTKKGRINPLQKASGSLALGCDGHWDV